VPARARLLVAATDLNVSLTAELKTFLDLIFLRAASLTSNSLPRRS
jgi:hypothetical protein